MQVSKVLYHISILCLIKVFNFIKLLWILNKMILYKLTTIDKVIYKSYLPVSLSPYLK